MNRTTIPEACEAFCEALSAFVDGELPFPESLPAVDHLAACDSCRRFYLDSRSLAERLASPDAPEAPEALWRQLEERTARGPAVAPPVASRRSRRGVWAASAALAATVVLALTLAQRGARPSAGAPVAAGASVPANLKEIVVEGARGRMTDERFVSLLAEILSADRKYHRETERVLRFVLGREGASEADDRDAPRTESTESREGEDESPRPAAARLPS